MPTYEYIAKNAATNLKPFKSIFATPLRICPKNFAPEKMGPVV